MKFFVVWSFVLISFHLHGQCPGDINSATTLPLGTTCTYSGPETQGFLASATLTIPETSTLIINDDYTIYDDLVIDGRVEVYGDLTVATITASVTISESGTLYVNGNYYNGLLGIAGTTSVSGTTDITGTYYNHLLSTTTVGIDATMQFNSYDATLGGTLNVPSGDEGCEALGCCGGGCASLPIKLLDFHISETSDGALVSWATGEESNNSHFEIQKRAFSEPSFQRIGAVTGFGTTTDAQEYIYLDTNLTESAYYRLKQIDFDGKYELFETKAIFFDDSGNQLIVYPNPTHGHISINGSDVTYFQITDSSGKHLLELYDVSMDDAEKKTNQALANECGAFLIRTKTGEKTTNVRIVKL
ncbi:MAG: T9SS type A sorting domain-containing protein [Cyclobacteriaceae bacterium]